MLQLYINLINFKLKTILTLNKELQPIIYLFEELSQAFSSLELMKYHWGYYFERKDYQSVAIVIDDSKLDKIIGDFDKKTIWYLNKKSNEPQGLRKVDSFSLWQGGFRRKELSQDTDLPIARFSFNDRRKSSFDLLDAMDFLPGFHNVKSNEQKNFEVMPKGILHIFNTAYFWVMKGHSNEPISLAVTYEENNSSIILYLSTKPDLRKKGYATDLLNEILLRLENKDNVLLVLKEEGHNLAKKIGFKNIIEIVGYSQK